MVGSDVLPVEIRSPFLRDGALLAFGGVFQYPNPDAFAVNRLDGRAMAMGHGRRFDMNRSLVDPWIR